MSTTLNFVKPFHPEMLRHIAQVFQPEAVADAEGADEGKRHESLVTENALLLTNTTNASTFQKQQLEARDPEGNPVPEQNVYSIVHTTVDAVTLVKVVTEIMFPDEETLNRGFEAFKAKLTTGTCEFDEWLAEFDRAQAERVQAAQAQAEAQDVTKVTDVEAVEATEAVEAADPAEPVEAAAPTVH